MNHRLCAIASVLVVLAAGVAHAGECNNNNFRPTFVRHAAHPNIHYVDPNGGFIAMITPEQAQATCQSRGVRQLIHGRDCFGRNWGDFACGCNITPNPNSTCQRYQSYLGVR
jgi:hypothetical protein